MPLPNLDWQDRGLCRDNPRLGPDTWFEITQYGQPNLAGFEALGECLRCPVQGQCFTYMNSGTSRAVIAGGGWWDHYGRFHRKLAHDALTAHAAAKILNMSIVSFRKMVREGLIPIAGRNASGQLFRLEDLKHIGERMASIMEEVA